MIFTGIPNQVDGFFINNRFACMLCGLGFDAKVAHEFARQPERGLSTYIKQVIRNFFSATTYSFEIELEKGSLITDAYFISIANSNQFGNNFTIAPKASLTDGLLDIVIVTNQNKLSVLYQTFRQLIGRNKLQPEAMITGKKGVIYFQTKALTIINKNNAPLHIDGDPAETSEKLRIEIAKKSFKLIF
jgi:diacylglycerol kinase (ATP)